MAKPNGALQAETLLAVYRLINQQHDQMIANLLVVAEVQRDINLKTVAITEMAAAINGSDTAKRAS